MITHCSWSLESGLGSQVTRTVSSGESALNNSQHALSVSPLPVHNFSTYRYSLLRNSNHGTFLTWVLSSSLASIIYPPLSASLVKPLLSKPSNLNLLKRVKMDKTSEWQPLIYPTSSDTYAIHYHIKDESQVKGIPRSKEVERSFINYLKAPNSHFHLWLFG